MKNDVKPAYLTSTDLTKTFDKEKLNDVIRILKTKETPSNIVNVIKELKTQYHTNIG